MELRIFDDARELRRISTQWLAENEAMNNVFFGVLAEADRYDGNNFWGAVIEDGTVVGVGIRTPPWPVAIAYATSGQALVTMLDALWETYDDDFEMLLPPIMASTVSRHAAATGTGRAEKWSGGLEKRSGQGVYQLHEVTAPRDVPGRLRPATLRDVDVVTEWMLAFHDESVAREGNVGRREHARRSAQHMTAAGEVYLWDVDGRPVSMAAARGATPTGIRISYVFTPLPLRKNGYASACVAALSQGQLDAGRERCFLFTDLANRTSNHIYQQIGYEYVGELNVYGV